MGIFWKASIHSWRGRTQTPMIDLGAYSDAIRLWLRGECTFPKHVSLWVTLSRPQRAQTSVASKKLGFQRPNELNPRHKLAHESLVVGQE